MKPELKRKFKQGVGEGIFTLIILVWMFFILFLIIKNL